MAFKYKNDARSNSNSNNDDRPDAAVWLNVGYNSVDASGESTFIGLPIGIALDTMQPSKARGSDEDWLKVVEAKNDLMEQLQRYAETLASGAEEVIPDLVIQIRRVNEKAQGTTTGQNQHLNTLNQLSFAQTKVA